MEEEAGGTGCLEWVDTANGLGPMVWSRGGGGKVY